MPRKHHGPYAPRHGEPVTDKTRSGRVSDVYSGTWTSDVGVTWSDGATERVSSSRLTHDHANCGDGGGINHCGW